MKFVKKSEFEFIETIRRRYSLSKIGDDCAILPKNSRTELVITADLLVEDVDFRLEWSKPEFIGHKAAAVSLSDIAAMGATPVWAMISVGVPNTIWETEFIDRFYDGYMRLARRFNVELVGGDLSKTPDKIVIDSIVAGEVKRGRAVRRSGAQTGDFIFVSGELGGAAVGLNLLENGVRYSSADKSRQQRLLLRQLQPNPRNSDGEFLGMRKLATAMIDLSDGLSSDLAHICAASNVGARIYAGKIPFDKELNRIAGSFKEKIDFALNGGEDFELLFTVNPKKYRRYEKEFEKLGFSQIGEITSNARIIELVNDNKAAVLQSKGFSHF